jgi:hypothetical protein
MTRSGSFKVAVVAAVLALGGVSLAHDALAKGGGGGFSMGGSHIGGGHFDAVPPTTNLGALGVPNQQSFGALPGSPGSATYDPYAALPSLGNQGSALAPTPGTSASGIRTPSTSSGM